MKYPETFRCPIFSSQHEFPAAFAPPIVRLPPQHETLAGINIQSAGIHRQELIPAVAAEHLDQRRIGVQQLAFWSAEVHPFLQGLEEFGKAALFLPLLGHVASQGADAHYLVPFYDRVQDTVEVKRARAVF